MQILALDVGSTRLKLALIDGAGQTLVSASMESPLQGARVQASDVLAAAGDAAANLCGATKPGAITITGATRTTVFTDPQGQALGDVVKLDESRGQQHAARLQRAYDEPGLGGPGAWQPLARALDLQQHMPDLYVRMRWLMELKDWINLRLTGLARTDGVTQARLQTPGTGLDELLATLGLKAGLIAAPMPPGTTIGVVAADAPDGWNRWQGVPVVQCGFDAWCASFGMGCVQQGAVYNVCGTTDVFGSFSAERQQIRGVSSLPWGNHLYHTGGPCLTGLGTLSWFGRQFLDNASPEAVLRCADAAGDDVPMCLPFVSGERMPFWQAGLGASFIEVKNSHGKPEFARALVDGLLVFQRWLLRLLCATPHSVYLGGGGATLAGWAALKAAAFGVPVRLAETAEPSLLGAAMCGQMALGRFQSPGQAQTVWVAHEGSGRTVQPDRSTASRLQATQHAMFPRLNQLHAVYPA